MSERIAILGAGRVGTALALSLQHAGHELVAVVDADQQAAAECAYRCRKRGIVRTAETLPAEVTLVVIATPDGRIQEAAHQLANGSGVNAETVVCHLSGSLTADVLIPLARRTSLLASCHPLASFSSASVDRWAFKDIPFALQGDPAALQRLIPVIESLSGRYFFLAPGKKTLYHIACVLASNYFVGLASMVEEVLKQAGIDSLEIMAPLWRSTLEHILQQGPAQALTGPVVRNDVDTVRRHLLEIKSEFPQFVPVYKHIGRRLLALARQQSPEADLSKMEELFTDEF